MSDSPAPMHPTAVVAFLAGCGLPAAWAQQPQWRILDTGFASGAIAGLDFLATWSAWRTDPARCQLLHYVATAAQVPSADMLRQQIAPSHPLAPLLAELAAQCWGLLPGVHRLRFDGGRVTLTLLLGDTQAMLRQQDMEVDSVYLGNDSAAPPNLHTLKAIARACRRGTRLAGPAASAQTLKDLKQCGFVVADGADTDTDASTSPAPLQATYNPAWEPRKAPLWPQSALAERPHTATPGKAVIIGAGIAGSACAQQLALRGWQVTVLDAASHPAAGASALPAGIFAPHTSSDDSVLSRITRAGLRTTVQWAHTLLQEGQDWQMTGVLERRLAQVPDDEVAAHADDTTAPTAPKTEATTNRLGAHAMPASWQTPALADAATAWSQPASPTQLQAQQLPADDPALWHTHAGWLRPAALVQALLQQPGIRFQGGAKVAHIQRSESESAKEAPWTVLDDAGHTLAAADLVVICAGPQSLALSAAFTPQALPLQPIRGQVSWAELDGAATTQQTPNPINGHGSWLPQCQLNPGGDAAASTPVTGWVMGSSFERDVDALPPGPETVAAAHHANWAKLQTLLPQASQSYARGFATAHTWAQVRCASADRLPVVGPLVQDAGDSGGVWVCTAMGSRGLTWAMLSAELLAARLHGEPLPIGNGLAKSLSSDRFCAGTNKEQKQ